MSDEDEIIQKFRLKASNPSSVYYVRQAEEMMRTLEKENFNLKLKIYFLESKHGIQTHTTADISNACNKEAVDIFLENESLKKELNEKKEIMSNALQVIELLEKQKEDQKKESQAAIDHLKMKSKNFKRKISNKHALAESQNSLKLQEELRAFKSQNSDLFARINDLKKENISKSSLLEKLSAENFELLEKCDVTGKNLVERDKIIESLRERFKGNACDNINKLLEENQLFKQKMNELSTKYAKLERECKDYQRIVGEQSEIMKALNRTIEAKNDEIDDYKSKIDFNDATPSFIQEDEINLNGSDIDNRNGCNFPFHNPLFGSFQSLYR